MKNKKLKVAVIGGGINSSIGPAHFTAMNSSNNWKITCGVFGMSKNQPFCDGTHHGTKHKPLLYTAKRSGVAKFCNCKLTKAGPFCDDSHLQA